MPFHREVEILSANYPRGLLNGVSAEAQDLLNGILRADPRKRLTLAEIQTHPWMLPKAMDSSPSAVGLFEQRGCCDWSWSLVTLSTSSEHERRYQNGVQAQGSNQVQHVCSVCDSMSHLKRLNEWWVRILSHCLHFVATEHWWCHFGQVVCGRPARNGRRPSRSDTLARRGLRALAMT
eukprot:3831787-Amphidinium_carterae.1